MVGEEIRKGRSEGGGKMGQVRLPRVFCVRVGLRLVTGTGGIE